MTAPPRHGLLALLGAFALAACGPSAPADGTGAAGEGTATEPSVVRVALFNIQELSAEKVDDVDAEGVGVHPQLRAAARIVQRIRPDVLVLNEVDLAREGYGLDRDELGRVVRRFQRRYLESGDSAVQYPHLFIAPSNTGILTGLDLNRDGVVATPADVGTRVHGDDSFGFGTYPGQYSMAVLSRVPLDSAGARTFQRFLWRDLPGHHMPPDFYSDSAEAILRLSSKSHWDLPVILDGEAPDTLHLLVSHPTPPVFDGPANRNGRRNFDEIGFWALYLDGSDALYDDEGVRGGLPGDARFVVAGDLNADPSGGEAALGDTAAIAQLLGHSRVRDPASLRGIPTASFRGGSRVDYLLPGGGVEVVGGGVYGPPPAEGAAPDEAAELAAAASDHRLVWLDLRVPGG